MAQLPKWLENAGKAAKSWFSDFLKSLKSLFKGSKETLQEIGNETKEKAQEFSDDILEKWTGNDKDAAEEANNTSDTSTDCTTQKCPCKTPAWVTTAKKEIGVKEVTMGNSVAPKDNNPRILEYQTATNTSGEINGNYGDDIPWCASFLAWCLKQTSEHKGLRMTANAKNFAKSCEQIDKGSPDRFRIGTIWGKNGHVTILVGRSKDGKQFVGLGGNQKNKVKTTTYNTAEFPYVGWPKRPKTKLEDACFSPIFDKLTTNKNESTR